MNRFKLTFTVLFTAILVAVSLPLQVLAQSQPDFKPFLTTTRMFAKNGQSDEYVVKTPYDIFTRTDIEFPQRAEYRSSFDKALKGGDWIVTQYTDNTGASAMVRFYWTETPSTKAKLRYNSGRYTFNVWPENWKRIDLHTYENGKPYVIRHTSSSSTIELSLFGDSSYSIRTVFATPSYTKDKSMEGHDVVIPQDSGDKQLIAPHFSISYNALNVTLAHKADLDLSTADMQAAIDDVISAEGANNPLPAHREVRKGYYIELRVFRDDTEGQGSYDHVKHIRPAEIYTHKLPSLGTYDLTAAYVIAECDKGANPQDMSTCSVRRLTYSKNYEFSPRHAKIVIDGNSGSYDTDKMHCTNEGVECAPPPLYEDCSVHDMKIRFWSGGPEFSMPSISSIWCTMKNWGVFISHEIIRPLFIPNAYRVSLLFESTRNNFMSSLGFLGEPFKVIVQFFDFVVSDRSAGRNCALPPLTVFGSTATVELCAWRHQLPDVWRFMQLVIQGGIALSFLWVSYSLVTRIFGVEVPAYEEESVETHPDVSRHKTDYVDSKEGRRLW